MSFCKKCGTFINDDVKFCPKCGTQSIHKTYVANDSSATPVNKSAPVNVIPGPNVINSSSKIVPVDVLPAENPVTTATIKSTPHKSRIKYVAIIAVVVIVVAATIIMLIPPKYDLTLSAQGNGIVTGAGSYTEDDSITISAVGSGGMEFYKWSDGNTSSTRTLNINKDTSLTAYFAYFYDIDVDPNYSERGTVTGSGHIKEGDTVTLTAQANYGYYFSGWESGGTIRSTQSNYEVSVTNDIQYRAIFEKQVFTISTTSSNSSFGSTSSGASAEYLDYIIITANPYDGYEFKGWYLNNSLVSSDRSYRLQVQGNNQYLASYAIIHDATFYSNNIDPFVYDTVSFDPKYNVSISSESWDVKNVDTGSSAPMSASGTYTSGGHFFTITSPGMYKFTRNIVYTDGVSASYSYEMLINQNLKHTFTWDYTYGYKEDHSLIFGLITWTTNETAKKTMTFDVQMDYKTYREYQQKVKTTYQYYANETHPYGQYGWRTSSIKSMVTYTDPVIKQIADGFNTLTRNLTSLERAQFTLNFVTKAIKYTYDEDSVGALEYWKFPYETLYQKEGDCEDTGFLFAAIAKAMGYNVCIINYPDHILAGISISGASGYSFTVNGVKYYTCETTGDDNYWGIGQLGSNYKGKSAEITVI